MRTTRHKHRCATLCYAMLCSSLRASLCPSLSFSICLSLLSLCPVLCEPRRAAAALRHCAVLVPRYVPRYAMLCLSVCVYVSLSVCLSICVCVPFHEGEAATGRERESSSRHCACYASVPLSVSVWALGCGPQCTICVFLPISLSVCSLCVWGRHGCQHSYCVPHSPPCCCVSAWVPWALFLSRCSGCVSVCVGSRLR